MDKSLNVDAYFSKRMEMTKKRMLRKFRNKALTYDVKEALKDKVTKIAQEYLDAQDK